MCECECMYCDSVIGMGRICDACLDNYNNQNSLINEPKCKVCGGGDAWYGDCCYQCALESGEYTFVG